MRGASILQLIGRPLLMLLLAAACQCWAIANLSAQEDLAKEFGGAQPAAPDGNAAAPAAAQPQDAQPAPPAPPGNLLSKAYRALGLSYSVVFLLISVTAVALVVMLILALRSENICPADLVEGVEQQLTEGNVPAAAEMVRSDESFLGQVLAGGLSKLDKGYDHAVEAMQEVGEEETMKIEHQMGYLALIGSISPMVGLFGTVQGMITTFDVIASSNSTPKPADLAGGISTALYTTVVGLLIAIPAIAVFNILRNRLQYLTLKVGLESEALLERFEAGH